MAYIRGNDEYDVPMSINRHVLLVLRKLQAKPQPKFDYAVRGVKLIVLIKAVLHSTRRLHDNIDDKMSIIWKAIEMFCRRGMVQQMPRKRYLLIDEVAASKFCGISTLAEKAKIKLLKQIMLDFTPAKDALMAKKPSFYSCLFSFRGTDEYNVPMAINRHVVEVLRNLQAKSKPESDCAVRGVRRYVLMKEVLHSTRRLQGIDNKAIMIWKSIEMFCVRGMVKHMPEKRYWLVDEEAAAKFCGIPTLERKTMLKELKQKKLNSKQLFVMAKKRIYNTRLCSYHGKDEYGVPMAINRHVVEVLRNLQAKPQPKFDYAVRGVKLIVLIKAVLYSTRRLHDNIDDKRSIIWKAIEMFCRRGMVQQMPRKRYLLIDEEAAAKFCGIPTREHKALLKKMKQEELKYMRQWEDGLLLGPNHQKLAEEIELERFGALFRNVALKPSRAPVDNASVNVVHLEHEGSGGRRSLNTSTGHQFGITNTQSIENRASGETEKIAVITSPTTDSCVAQEPKEKPIYARKLCHGTGPLLNQEQAEQIDLGDFDGLLHDGDGNYGAKVRIVLKPTCGPVDNVSVGVVHAEHDGGSGEESCLDTFAGLQNGVNNNIENVNERASGEDERMEYVTDSINDSHGAQEAKRQND